MSFDDLIDQVAELLARDRRVAYRVLKRRFSLDDEDIEDIKSDLIDAKQLAIDEAGKVLVWAGDLPVAATTAEKLADGEEAADRRLITVMFCDIVGSTLLSSRFDAEELREIVRAYQQLCASIIVQAEGHVAQYLGDGLLVYFGYPKALEDEASRCVRTALEIMQALRQDSFLRGRIGGELRVRIGIHTGHVVIGEMGGHGREERLALGDTPNIASRVQSVARPSQILITASTQRLISGLFDCDYIGEHLLKGVSTPAHLYDVRGELDTFDPFDTALSTGYLSRFVGRHEELATLDQRWSSTLSGEGKVTLISGDAGMGKTRLLHEFKARVDDKTHQVTFRCSPNHINSAYYPLAQLARRVFEIDSDDSETRQLEELAAQIERSDLESSDAVGHFAALLSLPYRGESSGDVANSAVRREQLIEAVTEWLLSQCRDRPLLVVWDDVHWMDPESFEILEHFFSRSSALPIYCLVAYRSDFNPAWHQDPLIHRLHLEALPDADVDVMIDGIDENEELPESVHQFIRDKTDGIPLYVEELTKNVLDSKLFDELGTPGSRPLNDLSVPTTLQDSLEARIDRCGVGRNVAQWAAVVGREFNYELMTYLIDDRTVLSEGIDELLDAQLIYHSGTRDERNYIFKHALIRDTAYESLLNKQRRVYHGKIADAIEKHFPEIVEREPEIVAHHLIEAGVHDRVVEHLLSAGQRAIARSAPTVAERHFRNALKTLTALPESTQRARLELNIILLLGPLVSTARGNASEEVADLYQRALTLCERTENQASRFPASFGLRAHYLARSELSAAHKLGLALLDAAAAEGTADAKLAANVALVGSFFYLGDANHSQVHIEQALSFYDKREHHKHALLYGLEPGSVLSIRRAQNSWLRGFSAEAQQQIEQALTHADEQRHPPSQVFVYNNAAQAYGWLGMYDAAQRCAEGAFEIASRARITHWQAWARVERGYARVKLGGKEEALSDIEQGRLLLAEKSGFNERSQLLFPWFITLEADALNAIGDTERALALIPEATSFINRTGLRWCESPLLRVRGELLTKIRLHSEAEKSLRGAMKAAAQTGAKGFEQQAAAAMDNLNLSQ